MCCDAKSMRSYAAYKGWETRRRRQRGETKNARALEGGLKLDARNASTVSNRTRLIDDGTIGTAA